VPIKLSCFDLPDFKSVPIMMQPHRKDSLALGSGARYLKTTVIFESACPGRTCGPSPRLPPVGAVMQQAATIYGIIDNCSQVIKSGRARISGVHLAH
jgi:hypothetical protein